jgi:hypothetical protein
MEALISGFFVVITSGIKSIIKKTVNILSKNKNDQNKKNTPAISPTDYTGNTNATNIVPTSRGKHDIGTNNPIEEPCDTDVIIH